MAMEITEQEFKLFGELLYNALFETAPWQWSNYEEVKATFKKVAPQDMQETFVECNPWKEAQW